MSFINITNKNNPLNVSYCQRQTTCSPSPKIKIYFEKNELLLMESKLEAFRINLLRLSKKYLNDNTRTSYLNFVNLTRKLISPLSTGNKKKVQKLLEEAQNQPSLVDREWFLEKLAG